MKFKPKVSIIIPVYNGENYFKEAIDSALNQTYNNIEVIVVNDGSIDNTEEIALSYGKKILYYKKSNGGVSTALNLGIKKMSGDYFSWLSHDDLYLPEKIETQINYLFQNNLINTNTILYSNYIIIDQNSEEIKKVILDTKVLNVKREYALLRGAINGITLLIPKKGFDDCGYFNENLRCAQDYDLWLRLQQKYKFIHIINVLTQTRIHNEQDTLTNPKVISEGNLLWVKMIESVLDERKVFLEENVYNYYYEMASFLGTSVYIKALEH
nr:glycosyltransferase [Mollicutes bacterium]